MLYLGANSHDDIRIAAAAEEENNHHGSASSRILLIYPMILFPSVLAVVASGE